MIRAMKAAWMAAILAQSAVGKDHFAGPEGKEGAPIQVRAIPGERATIFDGGLSVVEPASWLWIRDLEIAGSLPAEKRETKQTGSSPTDLPLGGGLNVHAGKGCKFINL